MNPCATRYVSEHVQPVKHPAQALPNFVRSLNTLRNNSIPVTAELEASMLSLAFQPLSSKACTWLKDAADLHGGCLNLEALAAGKCSFVDRCDGTQYPVDAGKAAALATAMTQAGTPEPLLALPDTIQRCGLRVRPLTQADYAAGLPLLLSAETGHCDIPGGAGANYPLAEYLSGRGRSCSVLEASQGHEKYQGHFNVWRLDDGRYLLGTLALRSDVHCASQRLQAVLWEFAEALLQQSPSAPCVLLGMGGQNLARLYPSGFEPGSQGHRSLGILRHAAQDVFTRQKDDVACLEAITGMPVVPGPLHIERESEIGMEPDRRVDMKNGMKWLENTASARRDAQRRCEEIESVYKTSHAPKMRKLMRARMWGDARMLKLHRIGQAVACIERWHAGGEWIKTGPRDLIIGTGAAEGMETIWHYRCQQEQAPVLLGTMVRPAR